MTNEEKMAHEYAIENWEHYEEGQSDYDALKQAFLEGYNKANEWHKVADGDLPKDNRYILIATRTDVYRGFYENNNWYGDEGGRLRCIAWKEIIPKEIKEND